MATKEEKHLNGEGLDYLIDKLDERYTGGSLDLSNYYNKAETASELDKKVDKQVGKDLSTNDFTSPEKAKLGGIEANAEVNKIDSIKVNGVSQAIVNKSVDITVPPEYTLPTASNTELGGVKVDGSTITIANGVISAIGGGSSTGGTSDYNSLLNKPSINGVALSGDVSLNDLGISSAGDYNDLTNKPTIVYSNQDEYKNNKDIASTGYVQAYINDALDGYEVPTDHTHTLSDITDIDISYSAQNEYKDMTSLASVGYVQAYVDDAIDGNGGIPEQLDNYYTKNQIDEIISNIDVDNIEVDLSNYYNKEETDELIENTSVFKRKIDIEGQKFTHYKEGANPPKIKTYSGTTILEFPNEVTIRIAKDKENPKFLCEEDYDEYTGTTITIPDTKEGYLNDYIIYNLMTEKSENVIAPTNIVKINNQSDYSDIISGGNNYGDACYYKAFTKHTTSDFAEENLPIKASSSATGFNPYTISLSGIQSYDGTIYYKDDMGQIPYANCPSTDSYDAAARAEAEKYLDNYESHLNTNDDWYSKLPDYRLTQNHTHNEYFSLPVRAKSNVRPIGNAYTLIINLGARGAYGDTFTIESVSGKPYGVMLRTLKSSEHIYVNPISDDLIQEEYTIYEDGYKLVTEEIRNSTKFNAYYKQTPVVYDRCTVTYVEKTITYKGLTPYIKNNTSIPTSFDGSKATIKIPEEILAGNPVFLCIAVSDKNDIDDLRVVEGEFSFSELTVGMSEVAVTSKNISGASETYKFNILDVMEKDIDYIRYSPDDLYRVYDLDNFYTKIQSDNKYATKEQLEVIENGSY